MADNENIVLGTRIKDFAKKAAGEDFRVAGDFIEGVDAKVKDLIQEAVRRAKENGRKTLQQHDL